MTETGWVHTQRVNGTSVKEEKVMTYIPTQNGFMKLEDSEKLLRVIFPNYPILEPRYPVPALEPVGQSSADWSN